MHWENQAAFQELFQKEPLSQLFVFGDRHFSCAGGEAGVDMMLAMIEREHGKPLARAVADMCLHTRPRRPTDRQVSDWPATMRRRNPDVMRTVAAMKANVETPLDQDELAKIFGKGKRQMERSFLTCLGESPKSYYLGLRLQIARDLLQSTGLDLTDIAIACGFSGRSTFSKAFKSRFGVAPMFYTG